MSDNQVLLAIITGTIALLGGTAAFVRSMVNRTLTSHETQTKALVASQDKIAATNEKVASGIHELTVSMSTGFERLDGKINRLVERDSFDRTKTDEDLPPVRSIRANTQKEG